MDFLNKEEGHLVIIIAFQKGKSVEKNLTVLEVNMINYGKLEVTVLKKKITGIIIAVLAIIAIYFVLYNTDYIGTTNLKAFEEQYDSVPNKADYTSTGTNGNGRALLVGIVYRHDYSDARYYIYRNKSGLPFGWCYFASGNLSDADGLMAFECGKYGTAYISLNSENEIQRMVKEDEQGETHSANTTGPIAEQIEGAGTIYFYDQDGNLIEPERITVGD